MSPQNFKFKSSLHNIHLDQSSLGNQQPEDEGKCNPKENFVQESFFRSLVWSCLWRARSFFSKVEICSKKSKRKGTYPKRHVKSPWLSSSKAKAREGIVSCWFWSLPLGSWWHLFSRILAIWVSSAIEWNDLVFTNASLGKNDLNCLRTSKRIPPCILDKSAY